MGQILASCSNVLQPMLTIVKGASGDLQVESIINFKAGAALGLTIPPSIMIRADEVTE
jgi:hypothetical protein